MKRKKHHILFTAVIVLFVSSCTPERPSTQHREVMITGIINEGKFNAGEGELSFYYEEEKEMINNVFHAFNGMALGASIQAVNLSPVGVLALVCNAPDKVHFVDAVTGKLLLTDPFTDELETPRGIALAESNYSVSTAFITNWGEARKIGEWPNGMPMNDYPNAYFLVLDLSNQPTVHKKVPCGNTAEGILLYQNRLYVAVLDGVKVYNYTALDSIAMIKAETLGGAARQLVAGANNKIWVSVQGAGIMGFSSFDYSNKTEYSFAMNYDGKMDISADGAYIYSYDTDYTNSSASTAVYKVNLTTGEQTMLFSEENDIYGIGVNPFTGRIYTANPHSYIANSTVSVYNDDGSLHDSVTSGILTSGFLFVNYLTD